MLRGKPPAGSRNFGLLRIPPDIQGQAHPAGLWTAGLGVGVWITGSYQVAMGRIHHVDGKDIAGESSTDAGPSRIARDWYCCLRARLRTGDQAGAAKREGSGGSNRQEHHQRITGPPE